MTTEYIAIALTLDFRAYPLPPMIMVRSIPDDPSRSKRSVAVPDTSVDGLVDNPAVTVNGQPASWRDVISWCRQHPAGRMPRVALTTDGSLGGIVTQADFR